MTVLDRNADTFPVGLAGTPFEEVYRALRIVAATVWGVDPLVYRAGMAWGWYALHDPAALTGFRDVVVAALISAIAPMVKDTQTDAELVEYLRQWRVYTPTFPKLQAIYALFGAVVDVQPISDPESQAVLPVDDTRLAFYIRIESVDFSRPLSLAEAREIAVRATPLGSRPYPYYALETRIPCTVSPAPVGIYIRLGNWETARPPAPPQQLGELVFVDASGAVVYSVESLNEMAFAPTGYFTIDDSDDVVFVEESPYPARGSLAKSYTPNVTIADGSGVDTELPYYSQKLYIPVVIWHDENWNLGADYFGWSLSDSSGSVYATNSTGSSRIVISIIVAMIDATDAEIVEVKNQSDAHFYAFKWTSGGTPYWYVVDGDEDWTDDLAADGYEEVPSVVLPTVSVDGDWSSGNWLYANTSGTNVSVLSGNSVLIGTGGSSSPTPVDYDTTKSYSVIRWATYQSAQGSGRTEYSIISSNDKIYAKNVTSGDLYLYAVRVAVCSSNQAMVVTVYNSSNVAYNAFKFTASGTDYYYVLDGVQADWTDDLAGIGYHIVLPHDDATGTISGITLPTAHSGSYTGVSFDSLRYYAKGTLSNTGSRYGAYGYGGTMYYGTVTWTDETLGDLTDKITVTDPRNDYLAKQTVFRIIFISSSVIIGYHPWDDNDDSRQSEQISSYSYNNGVHSITFYATSSWYGLEPEYGCIQFRYLDGTTTFNNLSAFDLVTVSSGALSKATSTNRYNMYNTWNGNITVHAEYTE